MASPKQSIDRPTGRSLLEWGFASLTLPGQTESGDLFVVQDFPNGVLVGAVDGIGHGAEAAFVAKLAIKTLAHHANKSVISLLNLVHEELQKTRGVVMTLASFNATENTMTWLGVGNVEGMLIHADSSIIPPQEVVMLRGGVVGYHLPPPYASVIRVFPGDTLILATDGVRTEFGNWQRLNHQSPQKIANRICSEHGKGTDDALVFVARYLGS